MEVKIELKSPSDIPQHVQDAFIATEDIRFYKHPGFDIKRLASSLWYNIKARAYVQGEAHNSTGGSQRLPVTKSNEQKDSGNISSISTGKEIFKGADFSKPI